MMWSANGRDELPYADLPYDTYGAQVKIAIKRA
jgi:hypothetical protein